MEFYGRKNKRSVKRGFACPLVAQGSSDEGNTPQTGDTILLAFSRGKDSIAAWISLRDSKLFKRIIPIYLYLVPGLNFEEDDLKYFEDVFQTHIMQLPHPSLYRMMFNNVFQPLGRIW